ncbi:MAG: hypothetical protein ACJAQW_002198 [Paracoccaceae bacterium]
MLELSAFDACTRREEQFARCLGHYCFIFSQRLLRYQVLS